MPSSSKTPLVSVIIPLFNREETIQRAIASVINQGVKEIEIIVVDDGSTDNSAEIVKQIPDSRITVISHEKNRGVCAARNSGIAAASAEYVAFQDSDDEWLLNKLEIQLEKFAALPAECVLVYCTKIVYGRDSQRRRGSRRVACVPPPEATELAGDLRTFLLSGTYISPQTMLIRRQSLLTVSGFDERIRGAAEWDLTYRLAQIGPFGFVDIPLVNTYLQPDSISNTNSKAHYYLLRTVNKMKRSGAAPASLAEHFANIGNKLGKAGYPARGEMLLLASIRSKPLNLGAWTRLLLNRITWNKRLRCRIGKSN